MGPTMDCACAATSTPSMKNVTVPVGVPLAAFTVAVNVTACVTVEGVPVVPTDVVVFTFTAFTSCERILDVLVAKSLSALGSTGLTRLVVPAGRHHIVLRYERPRWPTYVSLVAWLVLIGLAWHLRRRSRLGSSPSQPARTVETMLAMEKTDH